MVSGTIRNAVNLSMLQNKWQQKKDSNEVLSKKELNRRENWSQEEHMLQHFKDEMASNNEASIKTAIDGKIAAGGTLTPEEERYLEQKDPAALQKYRQAKMEKKAYEEKLKRCKTKDEVDRLKTNTMSGYLASFKKIENDPYIPLSEKLAKAQEMLAKSRNIEEVEIKFKASAEYEDLPTEAELTEERAEEYTERNEEALEDIEEAVENNEDESKVEDNVDIQNETDLDVNKQADNSDENSKSHTNEDNHNKKIDSEIDYHKEIQDIFNRIELNIKLDEGVEQGNILNTSSGKNKPHISITI